MRIYLIRKPRAKSSWAAIIQITIPIIASAMLFLLLDLVVAICIAITFSIQEPYRYWESIRFQEWKFAIELGIVIPIGVLQTCCIFVYAYVYILAFIKSFCSLAML